MAKKYRVAIVGCGGISNAHGNAWRNLPEIEIVGACDEKFESLARFATEYEVQNTYNDLRQMLEKQQPDVLVIATWPSSHLKNVLEAVRCGVKGILVEKPIAVNATQLEQMIQVTERAGILLMEAFMYRHHPLTLAVKQKIEDGAIGGRTLCTFYFFNRTHRPSELAIERRPRWWCCHGFGVLLHQHHPLSCWTRNRSRSGQQANLNRLTTSGRR